MQVVLADSFLKSLDDLPSQEQSAAALAALDFKRNPEKPGFKFHRVDKSKDPNFWSARVNSDIRMIVHRDGSSAVLCYVDHHDQAYGWAERRKFQVHPSTGAIQIVEVIEQVEKVIKKVEVEPGLLEKFEPDYLQGLGVPEDWVEVVRAATEDQLLDLLERLPQEAAERLMDLAAGKAVTIPGSSGLDNPFQHPDAQRRFRIIDREEEFRRALDFPWEKWIIFLHPEQRSVVEESFSGPARVSGSAGTGKSVVALHRAARLANADSTARVLLTTFSKTLAARLGQNADRLMGSESDERARIEIAHLHQLARELWIDRSGRPFRPAQSRQIDQLITSANAAAGDGSFSDSFLRAEWDAVIDPWGVFTWDEYRAAPRTGRGVPLGARQRKAAWAVFDQVRAEMIDKGLITWNQLCWETATYLMDEDERPFDHVIADEIQDFGPAEVRLIRALVVENENDLFLCGDSGQRIYKSGFSWRTLGLDARGRSRRLTVNYRTTEEIRRFADRLVPPDAPGGSGPVEDRTTVALLHGLEPAIHGCETAEEEIELVAETVEALLGEGLDPREIALFGRSERIIHERIDPALELCGATGHRLRDDEPPSTSEIAVGTMHRAKGLEFKAVIAVGCDHDSIPPQSVMKDITDPVDQQEFLEQEGHLLYVACTRARERLYVTFTGKPSPFLAEVLGAPDGTN